MKSFWTRNIERRGRWMRGGMGLALLGAAGLAWDRSHLLAALFAGGGAFALFEAARGWCLLRACGLKTRL